MAAVMHSASSETMPRRAPTAAAPVVIVGAGPAGIHTAQELLRRGYSDPLLIFGNEPWEPYNRVRLSSLLAGEIGQAELANMPRLQQGSALTAHYNCAVLAIDRPTRTLLDATGRVHLYRDLVLATGSRPHIPHISGTDLSGVFCFRDMNDAQALMARRVRSRRTVVLGGGVLGLEVARAMQRNQTDVLVVHHNSHLMSRQLDAAAAEILREQVLALGMQVVLGDGVREIFGEGAVRGVRLRSGREILCDTVVVSTGIRPNVQLALQAGLSVGRGIRVDDGMRSADAHIYAVGECAEHRGQVYGLAGPALEQAAVAAHSVLGGKAVYHGSTTATRLKVANCKVFSMGVVSEEERPLNYRSAVYSHPGRGLYRKLVLHQGRVIGAVAMGEWQALGRVQEAVTRQRRLWPWQLLRFRRHGELWPAEDSARVCDWSAATTVCNCTGVTRGALGKAMAAGCNSVTALAQATGASTVCGGCRPLLADLVGGAGALEKARSQRSLLGLSVLALFIAVLIAALPALPFSATVQGGIHLDVLWREWLLKQISGYTLAGLTLLGLLLPLRKRWPRFSAGSYPAWRAAHAVLGVLALIALAAHTGLSFGINLNNWLMSIFCVAVLLGSFAGGVTALENRIGGAAARRWRGRINALHLYAAWPLPVLLGFHITSVYYF